MPHSPETGAAAQRTLLSPATACPQVSEAMHELAESFSRAIDAKDSFTKDHSDQVAELSFELALTMGMPYEFAEIVHIAGHLHDIGKIGVPDNILSKAGALSEQEWMQLKMHPQIGYNILAPVQAMAGIGAPDMVRAHHERFDGKGYPYGLKGADIPLGGRIIALADSLSAMMQHRPYRQPLSFEYACAEVERCSGKQFDPEVAAAFWRIKDRAYELLTAQNDSTPVGRKIRAA